MHVTRLKRRRVIWIGVASAVASGLAAAWFAIAADRIERRVDTLGRLFVELEMSVGYSGFIHHFKNFVLRPDEPAYFAKAVASYQTVETTIAELERVDAGDAGLDFDLSKFKATLAKYRENLEVAAKAAAAGATPQEIDAAVRIPDTEATRDVARLKAQYLKLIDARNGLARLWRILTLLASSTVFACLALVAILTQRSDAILEGKAHDEVARARDQLAAVFSAVSSGVVGLDAGRNVLTLNPPARHLLGGLSGDTPFPWPPEIQFLQSEDMKPLDASADPVNRALAGMEIKGEIQLLTRKGETGEARYVRVSSAPIRVPGSDLRTVVVLDDISEQERNRQQIERRGRLDALGQLTGGIAHDFNNLLATVLYANDLALKEPVTDKARQYLERAIGSIERGRSLTSRLLAFAKRQPGRSTSRPVAQIFSDFQAMVAPAIEEQIAIVIDPPEPELLVFCDISQLENALLNLVLNSRDAILSSSTGTQIRLSARIVVSSDTDLNARQSDENGHGSHAIGRDYRFVEISVSDDGPGMGPEVRERATDPFFTTKSANSGTGLGLSLVYGFVQQANGELKIYSEPGQGTTVRITLPRGSYAGNREKPMPRPEVERGNGERVLVVEDEADLLTMVTAILEDLGYEVSSALSGVEAWERIEAGEVFDVLLSDVVMPGGIGGFELAKRLLDARPGTPVVLMSGYAGVTTAEAIGSDLPLLQKPCMPEELANALKRALSVPA